MSGPVSGPVNGLRVEQHVASWPGVCLAELDDVAALQTRVDRKYVLSPAEATALLDGLRADRPRVLEIDGRRTFAYASNYLDTPDLTTFHQAARRRRRRFKVRTRTYVDTGGTFLEVKTRAARGVTVKERRPADPVTLTLRDDDAAFVDDRLAAARLAAPPSSADLVPVLVSRYRRTTLLLPDARLTLDTALTWSLAARPDGGTHPVADVGDLVVVETKAGTAPSSADRLLWRAGHRPDRISKYATGLTLLRPELPDHPWRRLRRERLAA
ncbi:polyphosphate polymerase domain-containing protein [Isoptericola sp. S6320L]|uniref:polyphosphate polymerase domain-containing protein n=1 Tax=Isoptericola sp. S6320L TaxID=2926411 RepID=UPI001FF36876|nr:polyphosphate polymerase domain-containing protein [Isoptericola sp. S6320L]MCK0116492.1 polyphosphate polymerase domain-containing protein [Isoptericola sp. S6320L]